MMKIIQLGRFSGKANRDLGDKKIDGVDTRGFEITMEKFDSKVPKGTLSAWISKETHLPVLVEVRVEAPQNIHVTMRKFAWNVELDDKLFDTTPPVGYADKTPEAKTRTEPDSAKFVEYIVTALRLYAKTFDGQYPRETMSHGYDTHALAKKLGITQGRVSDQIPPETVVEFSRACVGGSFIKRVLRVREYKPAKYYGGTVTPNDASKVLLYWKTNDGFQVIFGDLKSRKVSAEELKRLKP